MEARMKAIVSQRKADGTYAEVGMNDQTVISGLKTVAGIRRRAARYARGPHRIQYFSDDNFYGEPFRVEHCGGGTGGRREK
jgi:hypothetical protein